MLRRTKDQVARDLPSKHEQTVLCDLDKKQREVFTLLLDSLHALSRENRDVYWASLVKETMKRKHPAFSETSFGFRSFSELLEEAEESGFVELRVDEPSGTYVVTKLRTGRRRRRSKS